MNTTKSTRRWYQYSLWNLFLLITILCLVPGGYVAYHRNRSRRQEAAVRAIEKLNGRISYKASPSPRSAAIQWLLGDDKYSRVNDVDFAYFSANFPAKVTDADLVYLEELEGLEYLTLVGTQVTDAGLARLQKLIHLKSLALGGTAITDEGLIYLQNMNEINHLDLADTGISDAGLKHLTHFSQLKELCLNRTSITNASVKQLKSFPHLELLVIEGTQITEEAADELDKNPGLLVIRK